MANSSWFVVCCLLVVVTNTPSETANVPLKAGPSPTGQPWKANGINLSASQPSLGSTVSPIDPKNASSSMYFHQLFSKESAGSSETKLGQPKPQAQPKLLAAAPSVVNHPTSIQAVNKTVNGGNLTSSETQQYYGYEPTVPMDVINNDEGTQEGEGDEYNDDEPDDADIDYDGESGEPNSEEQASPQQGSDDDGEVTERYNDERAQKIIDEIDGDISNQERDDRDDDFDHSASFTIPKIDPNHKGCKTVYKEIQTVPGKVKSADDDFDADFAFKRRRKRSAVEPKSATSSSFVIARECHFTDDENERKKLASPLPPPAAAVPTTLPTPMPIPSQVGAPMVKPTSGPLPDSAKPKVTGESRFVPINADPWRSPRGPRGIGSYGNRGRGKNGLEYDYKVSMTPFMAADEDTVKNTQQMFGHDSSNTRHFHQYPYPHYHIYYNRKGTSVLNENPKQKKQSNVAPQTGQRGNSEPEQNTYDSPNSYFEFTNPNGGDEQNQDEEEEEPSGEGGEGEEQGDDGELAASPPEGRASRNRRGLAKGRYSPPLPLPPTLSPSRSAGLARDDGYGWAVSGPNFYKAGKYHGGDGKKKPKKFTYNYFRREDPKNSDDPDLQDAPARHNHNHKQSQAPKKHQRRPVISGSTEIQHSLPQNSPNRSKKRSLQNDDDDYSIHYGGGNNEEFNHEYDSDKEKNKNKNRNNHGDGNHGGYGGGYDGQYQDQQGDGQDGQDSQDGHDGHDGHDGQDGQESQDDDDY